MTEEKAKGRIAMARSISLTPQEWKDLAGLASAWRTSRSGAFRRIWLEWKHHTSLEEDYRAAREEDAA